MKPWPEFKADVEDLLAQADRRLARPGATKALRIARDRVARNLDGARDNIERGVGLVQTRADGRSWKLDPAEIIEGLAHWCFDLRDHLHRDLVRADPDAARARRLARPIQPGLRVRFELPGREPVVGTVFQVVGLRAKIAPADGGRPWSINVDELEVVADNVM